MGFGLGLERLILVLTELGIKFPEEERIKIFIASLDKEADLFATKLVSDLRNNGIKAEKDFLGRTLKAQLKYANKVNAENTVVIGEEEIKNNQYNLKNMDSGETEILNYDELLNKFGGK